MVAVSHPTIFHLENPILQICQITENKWDAIHELCLFQMIYSSQLVMDNLNLKI